MTKTCTETWDKMVKVKTLKEHGTDQKSVLLMTPDFEEAEAAEEGNQEKVGKMNQRIPVRGLPAGSKMVGAAIG